MPVIIRPLKRADQDAWHGLWTAYLAFYGTSVQDAVYATTFDRLLGDDPADFQALVAEQDETLVGLAHFLFHRHCWRVEDSCYLQDLYTLPQMRGQGVGGALIHAVYDAAGDRPVYWLTQQGNTAARRLYDRVGVQTDFIKYQRPAA